MSQGRDALNCWPLFSFLLLLQGQCWPWREQDGEPRGAVGAVATWGQHTSGLCVLSSPTLCPWIFTCPRLLLSPVQWAPYFSCSHWDTMAKYTSNGVDKSWLHNVLKDWPSLASSLLFCSPAKHMFLMTSGIFATWYFVLWTLGFPHLSQEQVGSWVTWVQLLAALSFSDISIPYQPRWIIKMSVT